MDIFAIPQPPYKELMQMEKELELMDKMWGKVVEWQTSYNGWKDGKFQDIRVGPGGGRCRPLHCSVLCCLCANSQKVAYAQALAAASPLLLFYPLPPRVLSQHVLQNSHLITDSRAGFVHQQTDEMEEAAVRLNKDVVKLGRDVKQWPVWGWLRETIDAFKKTMPLITDLRNPAMRDRHWKSLMAEMEVTFNPTGQQRQRW